MSSKSKRFKKDSKPIDSGNFMISNTQLYDDDTKEMPIASPDTTYNEAPVDPVHEDTEDLKREDKNTSLRKLIKFIKSNYSSNLNTPKWKNFNGLKLQAKDKVRLNNVIWRTWFQQYGIKDSTKRKKPLICQFFSNDIQQTFDTVDSVVVLEGTYWKRKLESITNEYKKWREFSRKRAKQNNSIFELNYYPPIATSSHSVVKQTFSNRCRSPSPRLFQDLQNQNLYPECLLFNEDDPRDPRINSDNNITHQPPNNHNQTANPTTTYKRNDDLINSFNATTATTNNDDNNNNNPINNLPKNYSLKNLITSPQKQIQSIDYDITSFGTLNTLATVAAQSPHLSNQEIQYTATNTQNKLNFVDNTQHQINFQTPFSFQNSITTNNNHNLNSLSLNDNNNTNRSPINRNSMQTVTPQTATTSNNSININSSSNNTIRNLLLQQPMKLSNNNINSSNTNYNNQTSQSQPTLNVTPSQHNLRSSKSSNTNDNLLANSTVSSVIRNNQTSINYSNQQVQGMRLPMNMELSAQLIPTNIVSSSTTSSHQQAILLPPPPQNLNANNNKLSSMDNTNHQMNYSNNQIDENNIVSSLLKQMKSPNSKSLKDAKLSANNTNNNLFVQTLIHPTTLNKSKAGRKPSDKSKKQNNISAFIMSPSSSISSQSQLQLPINKSLVLNNDSNSYSCIHSNNSSTMIKSNNNNIAKSFLNPMSSDSNSPGSENSSGYHNKNNDNNKQYDTSNPSLIQNQKLSTSDSINVLNESSCISTVTINAEQKRRCNIQYGFEKLYHIVPSLRNSITCKVSKASMLQKAAEHIHQLKSSQNELNKELNDFKNEINSLSDQISDLQNELPENGVSILGGNINKTEKFRQKFNAYVQERTIENWKFYIFSTVMKPLFENYIESINTVSKEELEHSVMHWHSQYCNLTNLRPCVSGSIRQLSKTTSILIDPTKLPEECYKAAISKQ